MEHQIKCSKYWTQKYCVMKGRERVYT